MLESFAIVTPSFAPDYERCRLLCESVERYVAPHVRHYVVVDHRDMALFGSLRSSRIELVAKQDVLPWWLIQVPRSRKWWLNAKGLPVRGWIVQQLTKLSVPQITPAKTIIFIDSDSFFVRSYDPRDAVRDGRSPMFRELLADDHSEANVKWHQVAAGLLGMAARDAYATSYVTQLVTWRRENVLLLHREIERVNGRPWVETLVGARTLSEYVLYGFFCECVLKEAANVYHESRIDTLNYWATEALDDAKLAELRQRVEPYHVAVMVSTKSSTPVGAIRRAFGFC